VRPAAAALAALILGCGVPIPEATVSPPAFRVGPPNAATVAAAFNVPPRYPGYPWSRDGRRVPLGELTTAAGPDHCGWQSATLLSLGWPPGTVARTAQEARQYIRDPEGVVSSESKAALGVGVRLPSGARPSGYQTGTIKLYLSPSDQDDAVYLVSPQTVERWPRARTLLACA